MPGRLWEQFAPAAAPPPAVAGNPWDNDPVITAAPSAAASDTSAVPHLVFQSVAPRQIQPTEPGYAPGRMTNLSPQDLTRFYGGSQPASTGRTPNPFDQFDAPRGVAPAQPAAPGHAEPNPFDQFDAPASSASGRAAQPWDHDPVVAPAAAPAAHGAMPWDHDPVVAVAPAPGRPWEQFSPQQSAGGQGGEFGYAYATAPDAQAPASRGSSSSAPPQPPSDKRTGLVANAVAGAEEGAAGLVNTATDPVSYLITKPLVTAGIGAYNLGARVFGYDPVSAKAQHDLLDDDVPTPGGAVVDAAARAVGAPTPAEVTPGNALERYARAGAGGAVGMAALGPAGMTRQVLGTGAASGIGSQVAADVAPDDLKPAAALVGGVVGPKVPSAVAAPLRAVVGAPLNALAGYAGPAVGRTNPLLDVTGQQFTTDLGQPLAASSNQVNLAATRARGMMSDPTAVQNALNTAPPPVTTADGRVAGPTTGQLTRDPNLISAEQQAAAGPAAPAFQARAAAQNDARVAAIRGVADGADPGALPAALQRQAADADAAQAARVQSAGQQAQSGLAQAQALVDAHKANLDQRAQQAAQGIGGDYPAGSDAQLGAAVRAPLDAAQQAARKQEGALWQGIDPNGTLAVDMRPVRNQANTIVNGIGPNAAKPTGNEASILKIAQSLPNVQSFRDLQDLRQQLTDGIRTARANPKANSQTVPRLQGLLDAVHDSMAKSVNDSDLPGAAGQAAAGTPGTSSVQAASDAAGTAAGAGGGDGAGNQAPAVGSAVYTPSGRRIDVRYGVREAGDLTASQLPDGRNNPAYPQELQPRDRTRAASQQQVSRIASTLEPERLGPSASTAEGAPIVGPDGVVESGNGRTLAIQQAHAQGGPQSQAYRDYLAQQGYDVAGMKAPVLVRERTTPLTDAERPGFADDAGSNPVLSMSAAERAAADAKRIPGDMMDQWRGGDVTDARNRDFVRAFAQHVLPEGEHAAFMTGDGALSTDGANRVRNALTQHAYGSNDLVAGLAENADPNLRAFGGALQDAAGPMAKLRSGIDAGNVSSSSDLARPLVEAANLVQDARRRGISIADAVAQQDAFSQRDPMVEPLLRAAYGDDLTGRMSRAKFSDLLGHYADEAQQQGGLFGANLSRDQMVGEAAQRYGYRNGQAEASAPGAAPGAGTGAGADGNPALRPGDGSAGQTPSGLGGGTSAPGSSPGDRNRAAIATPPVQQLTANFDRAAADRYAAARQATADRVATFKSAPGVGQVLQGGPAGFRTADNAVPGVIVRAGTAGADVAKAYLKAGGTPEALSDAAAFSLRQAAMKDGVIDPAKYEAWARERQSFLSQIPDAAAKFGAAAEATRAARAGAKTGDALLKQAATVAQRTVDDAMAARATATREQQSSVAGKFLGGADPVRQVGAILRSPTAEVDAAHLARLTQNDPEARAGLRRAVADYILRDLKGNGETATSAETFLRGDQLRTFLRNSGPALSKFMTPADMQGLRSVADSLAQTSVRPGGGTADLQQHGAGGNSFMKLVSHELFGPGLGGSLGAAAGTAVGGHVGAFVGATAGTAIGKAVQAAREAGLKNVDHLVAQALLNPALMRTLLSKATPQNTPSLMTNLASQLRPLSLVSAVRGAQPQQDRPALRRGFTGAAMPQNALTALPSGPAMQAQPRSNALLMR